jgi:hypothetical protein
MVESTCPLPTESDLQTAFLSLLPLIENHARVYFRHLPCADQKADKIAETVAVAWQWYRRLAERGKDVNQFVITFIRLAARAVRSGRRLCGMEKAKDVLSPRAQRRHGFRAEPLPQATQRSHECLQALIRGQQELDAYEERLQDNLVTPPPDAAAFRIDFPEFLGGLSERDRALAMFLSLGHRPSAAATRFGLTPGRVTQLRQAWCGRWRSFQGEGAGNREELAVSA